MSVKMHKETVTPKKASKWLQQNERNRPCSIHRAKVYAQAIKDGVWKLNGETIKFNCNGDLIDGQHRLHAVVMAGQAVESYILTGLPADAFDTIDGGRKRSNADRLARRGEKHYTLLAAVVARVWCWEQGERIGSQAPPRPDIMDEVLSRHGTIREAVSDIVRMKPVLMPLSDAAFLMYAGRVMWGHELSDPFWESVLLAEGLLRGTPAYTLYQKLHEDHGRLVKMGRTPRLAMCIKAFNAAMQNRPCKVLRWGEGEEFPEFAQPRKRGRK